MQHSEKSNKILIEGCLAKNQKSQKALFDTFAPTMYAICLRYSGNADQAKDLLQDGFIKVFTKLSEFKFEGSFEGWMKKIFINLALEYLRKESRQPDMINVEEKNDIHSSTFNLQNIDSKKIIELIQKLPAGYRTAINLFIIEGYSHKEIAQMLGITESTSKSQLFKARQMLQKMLKDKF
ncbi:MAG: sigma-70 family RNA polymerase sigma factor [Bacteroidetes bacterium]|nr:sigma-70 family RNA polymerase sigma factor [Bacteroidota bacterium]